MGAGAPGKGVAMGNRVLSNGVEVALGPNGRIHWASDWSALVRLEISGTGEVTRRFLGAGTYCHTDYYLGGAR